ncbi:protein LOL1 isoform X2 [Ziziphus jujuba]|uniref:Protein LOL1 isoform X2 n=1 Tax=Ziziphus jujuba TaxID=326968 RepID=A0ABM3IJE0_ZIZJJ|nr:protein LOL1 isoform X2 [Ziziphus jujuba]
MQSQLVCNGCRSLLLYPRGATNVCCALCNTLTSVPPPGMEMAQLVCGGCRTLLMYTRGATSVRCSCCHTMNLASASNQFAQVNCGNCRTMLMYPYGAPSVKCAVCHHVTNVGAIPGFQFQCTDLVGQLILEQLLLLRLPCLILKAERLLLRILCQLTKVANW